MIKLKQWLATNRVLLSNANSLIGTTLVTSGLGFAYWWVAARLFAPSAVGFAAAAIAAMTLLGTVGMLGLGTLLIRELPRQPQQALTLIVTALVVSGGASIGLGILLALGAPLLVAELSPLASSSLSVTVFALGVGLTGITLVLDQALIGLLRGGMRLWRNVVFAVIKLGALVVVGRWLTNASGLTIYGTWLVGSIVSLVVLLRLGHSLRAGSGSARPQLTLLRGLARVALGHHVLNLGLLAPGLVLPLLVTALLGAALNASFYMAWMVANFVFVGPAALGIMLYAIAAREPELLPAKMRLTLKLAAVLGIVANVVLVFAAEPLLLLFGRSYAEQAAWALRILGLGVFAAIVKDHYVVVCRIRGQIKQAAVFVIAGDAFELGCAAVGAMLGGLAGLSLGWVLATTLEALVVGPSVYRAIASAPAQDEAANQKVVTDRYSHAGRVVQQVD